MARFLERIDAIGFGVVASLAPVHTVLVIVVVVTHTADDRHLVQHLCVAR